VVLGYSDVAITAVRMRRLRSTAGFVDILWGSGLFVPWAMRTVGKRARGRTVRISLILQ
jgi:hypothetical protein